jgi:hypothetical protein
MNVNKIKILNTPGSKDIVVPLSTNWDLQNREDAIVQEQNKIIEQIVGEPINYELQRFSKVPTDNGTSQEYTFNFINPTSNLWEPSYLVRFDEDEVRYFSKQFKKSFFKLDLFDTMDPKKQKNYLSIILPTSNSTEILSEGTMNCQSILFNSIYNNDPERPAQIFVNYTDCCGVLQSQNIINVIYACVKSDQPITYSGFVENNSTGINSEFIGPIDLNGLITNDYVTTGDLGICECNPETVGAAEPPNLTYPNFYLDHVGVREGYFIYWYQNESLINLDTFYMTAKFFDATNGTFTRFTNVEQSPSSPFTIPNDNFYYKVILDYNNYYYRICNTNLTVPLSNIVWYEYKNPPK